MKIVKPASVPSDHLRSEPEAKFLTCKTLYRPKILSLVNVCLIPSQKQLTFIFVEILFSSKCE